jgi:hypothetical protein
VRLRFSSRGNILFIVADGELQMSWHDTVLFVVTRGITSELEDFGSKVFKYSSKVYRGACTTEYPFRDSVATMKM